MVAQPAGAWLRRRNRRTREGRLPTNPGRRQPSMPPSLPTPFTSDRVPSTACPPKSARASHSPLNASRSGNLLPKALDAWCPFRLPGFSDPFPAAYLRALQTIPGAQAPVLIFGIENIRYAHPAQMLPVRGALRCSPGTRRLTTSRTTRCGSCTMQQLRGWVPFLRSTPATHSGTASLSTQQIVPLGGNLFARMFQLMMGHLPFWGRTRTASIRCALALQWQPLGLRAQAWCPNPEETTPPRPAWKCCPQHWLHRQHRHDQPLIRCLPEITCRPTRRPDRAVPGSPVLPQEAHHQQHQRVCPAVLQLQSASFVLGKDDNARLPAF